MDPVGHLKFPQSGEYDNNLECVWKISAPFGTVSGLRSIITNLSPMLLCVLTINTPCLRELRGISSQKRSGMARVV